VTYPVGLCLCLYDSATGESRPLSKTCAGLSVCGGAWRLSYADTCPQPPQVACVPIGVFGPERILLNFDQLDAGTYLFDQYPGVTFEHAVVVQSEYAASPQNVITPDESGAPIRVNFDPPVLRVGCFIDADGFTPERMPQIRAFGVEGTIESCNYEQGLNFKGLSLPDGIPIAAIELGCLRLWDCGWGRSDSFDDLVFEYATAEGSPEGPMMLNNGGGGGDSDEAAPASGQDQAAASPSPFLPYDETTAAAWEAFGDWMAAQTWGPESGLTDEEQWALTLAKLHELGLVRR
jgi:hypothetical protein